MSKADVDQIRSELARLREQTKSETEAELNAVKSRRSEANRREKAKENAAREQLKDAGLPIEEMEREDERDGKDARERIDKAREEYLAQPSRRAIELPEVAAEKTLALGPDSSRAALVGRELYASDAKFLEGIEGDTGNPLAIPYDPHTANPWCWASGSGWWGSADIAIYSTFWYYFYPWANRHFSVQPLVTFRGFYILHADDKWWNSKYAKVECDVRIRAYQYNWKAQSVVPVLNHGDDNINLNTRFDDTRHHYYSFLAGEGDLAWIRIMVRLYAYARGDGSYAELNFGTGSANYLQVPHCHVF